jgi:hypothetical protein
MTLITRRFSQPGQPYAGLTFVPRQSRITQPNGSVVFEATILAPESWSQVAVDILAQKYVRKAGVPSTTIPVDEAGIPSWLQRRSPAPDATSGAETDARQVFERLAGAWTYQGFREGYFASEDEAPVFFEEILAMLAHQMAAPNSPQWFNTGLYWAYGIAGEPQGQFRFTRDGEIVTAEASYVNPLLSACFPAGTLVETASGFKRIEKIKVGDSVSTHLGRFRPVFALHRRTAKKLVKVSAHGYAGLPLIATPEHPVLVVRSLKDGVSGSAREAAKAAAQAEWLPIGDVQPGDRLVLSYPSEPVCEAPTFDLAEYAVGNGRSAFHELDGATVESVMRGPKVAIAEPRNVSRLISLDDPYWRASSASGSGTVR